MLWRTVCLIVLLAAAEARAGATALSGDDIKQTVAGAVFAVDTPLGSTLPISYGEDGRMSAEAGPLAYILGSPTDSGTWWISANRLCQKWRRWFDGAVHCLRLSQDGMRVFWRRDDGETGTASIVARPERGAPEPAKRRVLEARASAAQISLTPSPPPPATTSSLPDPKLPEARIAEARVPEARVPEARETDVADEAPGLESPVPPRPPEASTANADA